ncbi:hypothetical protein ATY48_15515 [Xanthomonas oryzae pv. oryzae]|nr:hypothetical protein ATY43_11625 [Xanthomonas oryzae pv. oryzae]AOS14376.1 hypothetical protein ATY45_07465 [Xanthomonas oryzae pv. oryzae]AOS28197.1 hypothetical protein ATY48_15515 [Xanthomonas oryzae pv. oryzae]AOS32337.1 hypothetical protein ATY49_15425 [Xanthomonas oryzae pv. oryzae]AQU46191.1 hypothetical protein ABM06_15585 [Xanthomonas oryzae pv. oryzae]
MRLTVGSGCTSARSFHASAVVWRPCDVIMPGYQTQIHELTFGQLTYVIRALAEKQQYADPDHTAAKAGISSAQWSLFGRP